MTNFDYYQEEMLVAAMTGGRCKFITEHIGAECASRTFNSLPACNVCADKFKEWLRQPCKEVERKEAEELAYYRLGKEVVKYNMSRRALLEQLAEECSELAIAALKLIRAESISENPTPINANKALANFHEELSDVVMILDSMGMLPLLKIVVDKNDSNPKWARWADRIEAAKEETYEGKIMR